MSIELPDDELWAFVRDAHTGVLCTLRRDGRPVALPVWFVVLDRRLYVTTPEGSAKVTRVRHDPRASFLVESGRRWRELRAVTIPVTARTVDDDDALVERCGAAMADKYGAFREPAAELPARARARYATMAVVALTPSGRILSWDNARIARSP